MDTLLSNYPLELANFPRTLSLLIYDDDGNMLPILEPLLEQAHFTVSSYDRSGEVLKALEAGLVDLVVICSSKSGDRYLRLCRAIHRKEARSYQPVPTLMLCRHPSQQEAGLLAGATEVLEPAQLAEQLLPTIEKLTAPAAIATESAVNPPQAQLNLLEHESLTALIAEDAKVYQLLYRSALEELGCQVIICENGQEALKCLDDGLEADLIITDINMPVMNGTCFIQHVRQHSDYAQIPIVVSTSMGQLDFLDRLFAMGVNDYLTKPFHKQEFACRVSAHLKTRIMLKREHQLNDMLAQLNERLKEFNQNLDSKVQERTAELYETQLDVIYRLAKACEYRDDSTGNHIHRVGYFSQSLACAYGLDSETAEKIGHGSLMHDVGKIAIPDSILQKPGRLTPEERSVMETHTLLGEEILGNRPFLREAVFIAGGHHEKWDGSGYPRKLKGEDIPLGARIVAIVDVFDALLSRRCYKEPIPLEEAVEILKEGKGSHFDPLLLDLFLSLIDEGVIGEIMERFPYQ